MYTKVIFGVFFIYVYTKVMLFMCTQKSRLVFMCTRNSGCFTQFLVFLG